MLCCAAFLPLVMTAACGQKGALYLPPRNGTVVTRPADSAPVPEPTTPSNTPQTTNPSTQDTTSPSTPSESSPSGTQPGKKDNSQMPPK
jgi:predicted small lipoprotein YifL